MDNFIINKQVEEFEDFVPDNYFIELEENFLQLITSLLDIKETFGIGVGRGAARKEYDQIMADDIDMKEFLKNYGIVSFRIFEAFLKEAKFMLEKGERNE